MPERDIEAAYDRARDKERSAKDNFVRLNAGIGEQASLHQLKALSNARKEWDVAVAEVKRLAEEL